MPELPEVETIVRGLRTCLPGRRIARVMVGPAAAAHILQTPPAEFVQALEGASVVAIQRYGKHILLRMAPGERGRLGQTGFWWVVHLGMTGQFVCEPSWHELPRHTHAWFELEPIQKIAANKPADEGRRAQVARQVALHRHPAIRPDGDLRSRWQQCPSAALGTVGAGSAGDPGVGIRAPDGPTNRAGEVVAA